MRDRGTRSDVAAQARIRSVWAGVAVVVALASVAAAWPPGARGVAAYDPDQVIQPCDAVGGPPTNARFEPIGAVALNSGGFELEVPDLTGNGTLASVYTRSYFSLDTRTTSLGSAWTHNFLVRLRLDSDHPGDVLFTQPNVGVERFVDAWGNTPATGKNRGYRVLDRAPDGTWTVTDEATVWHFTSGGDLMSVESPDGSAEARYRGNLLVQIAGPDGPTIGFEYRPDGRLAGVVDLRDHDRFVRYEYDPAGRLAHVSRWDGSVEAYAYDGTSARIASIEDRSGRTLLRLTYDEDGRVIREQDTQGLEDGEAVSYEYEALDNGWLRTTVTYPVSVVEPGWHPIEQSLHDANGFVREMRFYPTSDQELVGRYDYDPENRRIVVEDPCPPAVGIDQAWPWPVASPWVILYLVLVLFGLLLPG